MNRPNNVRQLRPRNRTPQNRKKIAKKGASGRNINDDNLTSLERSILNFMLENSPVSVKQIAENMFGEDVEAEGKGKESIRTVRNALRVPKAMGLIEHTDTKGIYVVSNTFKKIGFTMAEKTATAWRLDRERRKEEEQSEVSP